MSELNVEAKVKEILAKQLSVDVSTIKLESTLVEDLNLDSFGAVELAFALEDTFGFKISDDAVYKAKIVKDIVDYINSQLPAK